MRIVPVSEEPIYLDAYGPVFKRKADYYDCNDGVLSLSASPAQEAGVSPCPSTCPDLSKSQTLSSLSESGAVLVEVCCLLVLAVDNKVSNTHTHTHTHIASSSCWLSTKHITTFSQTVGYVPKPFPLC